MTINTTKLSQMSLEELLNVEIEKYEAGKEQIARTRATLFVESMQLQAGAGNV